VFIGYSNHHKGYKCLHVSTGRVYISRNIIFDENVFPFSRNSNPGSGVYCANDLLTNVPIQPVPIVVPFACAPGAEAHVDHHAGESDSA
jgi:hypothetical protein